MDAILGELDYKQFRPVGEFHRHISDILATMADIVQPHAFEELKKHAFDLPPATSPDAG